MSRIGFKTIDIPAGVEIKIDGNLVSVKGPKGELQEKISDLLTVEIKDGVLEVKRSTDKAEDRSQHGLARTLINNMVVGVTEGYQKKLQLVGVGYKTEKKGNTLVMNIGYSHPVEMPDPEGIVTECPDASTVIVKGINKAEVGNYAANVRAWRKPEPYKGKGIKYEGEHVRRKEGKTGVKA
ncbi:MAG: 50S ribosomal protein L6 [Eubacteriales bacterium]|nr:50S ribosomal protein L6 [Eubacteriales bacterium]